MQITHRRNRLSSQIILIEAHRKRVAISAGQMLHQYAKTSSSLTSLTNTSKNGNGTSVAIKQHYYKDVGTIWTPHLGLEGICSSFVEILKEIHGWSCENFIHNSKLHLEFLCKQIDRDGSAMRKKKLLYFTSIDAQLVREQAD